MAQPPFQGAGPNQVRAYLADLLIHKHDVSPESAKSIADLWQLGQGRDLRQETERDFIDIFGKPVGRYLYRTVSEAFEAEWRASVLGIINFWAFSIACVAAGFFCIRAASVRSDVQVRQCLTRAVFCGPIIMISGILESWHWGNTFHIIMSSIGGIMTFIAIISILENSDTSSGARAKQDKDSRDENK